jgi:predicted hydrocarbon binding protein
MRLKEDLFKWFVRNIVYAKNEIIDRPGFIVCQYTEKGKTTYMREIFYPEAVWVKFEKNLIDKYGDKGKQAIYSAGKRFGYSYTHASGFSKMKDISRKTFENNVYFFLRYIECVWTNRLEHEIDYNRELFKATFDDYVVCPKNGKGYLMMAGCVAGWWAYLIDDKNAEGIQTRCVGRGDEECEIICGHNEDLQRYNDLGD